MALSDTLGDVSGRGECVRCRVGFEDCEADRDIYNQPCCAACIHPHLLSEDEVGAIIGSLYDEAPSP